MRKLLIALALVLGTASVGELAMSSAWAATDLTKLQKVQSENELKNLVSLKKNLEGELENLLQQGSYYTSPAALELQTRIDNLAEEIIEAESIKSKKRNAKL